MAVIGEIGGVTDVVAALRALPGKVAQDEVMVKALTAGAGIVREQAKANLVAHGSVDTGLLANTMTIRRKADEVPNLVEVILKPSTKLSMVVRKGEAKPSRARPSKYAHWIEFGTEQSAAEPFLRPAVDSKREAAVNKIRQVALAGVAAAAAKLKLK